MKILTLTLKKKWFDMIISGEKKEEYREIKPYWEKRLTNPDVVWIDNPFKEFDAIHFKNGYAKNAPSFLIECKKITMGVAVPKWSDNMKGQVFVIKLGEIIKK